MKKDFTTTLRGKRVKTQYRRLKHNWGDHEPGLIRIARDAEGVALLDVLSHECTHELLPFLSEEAVTAFATELAKYLWKAGYRMDGVDNQPQASP